MAASSPHRGLAGVLALLAAGVLGVALLGPLAFDVIEYHLVDDVLNQVMGGDAVAMVLVAPVALFSAALLWSGHRAGPVVGLAPAGYAMYTYPQLALGGEFATEPGNSEKFFPLFLAIFILAAGSFISCWRLIDDKMLPMPSKRLRQAVVSVFLVLSAFLALGLHLPGLIDVIGGTPYETGYTQSPTVFWIVKLMDLGIVVPVMVVAAHGARAGAAWANRLMYVMLGWGALLGSAVAGMGVVMVANDDPAASVGITVGFLAGAAALLWLAARLFGPLFDRPVDSPIDLEVAEPLIRYHHRQKQRT